MYKNLVLAGSIAGILGIATCFIAGLARIAGYYYLAGYQSTTIFNVGIGLMVFACLVKLDALQSQTKQE
jgi:type IV secretory pathway VirB2 component (pilin)